MKKYVPILLMPVLLALGCKKNDDLESDKNYYQLYEVEYNKVNAETRAYATFRENDATGRKVELKGSANVKANTKIANTTTEDITRYYWDFPGTSDVNFVLTKNYGGTIRNTVRRAEIGDIKITTVYPEFVPKSEGLGFKWAGDPLQENEKLVATIISGANLVRETKEFTGDSVYFTPYELSEISPEWVTVQLKRIKELPLENKDHGKDGKMKVTLVTYTYTTLQ
ncbi:MAG TPA: hypothetical protein VGD89_09465 [Flavipsychrobacter sp.]